jgi:putative glutathione S-transferase
MGLLVKGRWQDAWYDTGKTGGRFVRGETSFRDRVTADGSSGFRAESGRYHLYVSLACPWAHRTLIFRKLKRLEDVISLSIVDPLMGAEGWTFSDGPGCIPDTVNGARRLYEVYVKAKPDYTGRVTVPVLWDRQRQTIVNNESAEIIRMLNSEFDAFGDPSLDFYPAALRSEIDALNAEVYAKVNNGVYRCGFATTQEAYEEAFGELFETLAMLDVRLACGRYLFGDRLTEADWRLFTTLVRFDPVYFGHFKCNLRRIADHANLSGFLRDLYQVPGVAGTVNFAHIKRHYYASHRTINPTGIVPLGPAQDLGLPHHRATLASRG